MFFMQELSDLLNELPRSVILVGDLNYPEPTATAVDPRLDMTLFSYNISIINDDATRLNPRGGSMSKLDVIVESNNDRQLCEVETIPVGFSDHWLLRAQFHHQSRPAVTVMYQYRNWRQVDITVFRQHL